MSYLRRFFIKKIRRSTLRTVMLETCGFQRWNQRRKTKFSFFFATSFRWGLKISNEASDWLRAHLAFSFRFDPSSQPIGSQRNQNSVLSWDINLADPSLERSLQMLRAAFWMSSIGQLNVDFCQVKLSTNQKRENNLAQKWFIISQLLLMLESSSSARWKGLA